MKAKYFFSLIILFLLSANIGQAQSKQWTLEDCIDYAIKHNLTIKKMEIQQNTAKVNLNSSEMSRLPNLNVSIEQKWDFSRTQILTGVYENKNQSNTNLSVSSSIPVFTGFRIPNEIAQDKLELQVSIENLSKAKEDLSLNIASLFLRVLLKRELLKINKEQFTLSQMQIEKTEILVNTGKVPPSQLYDIQAQVANDKVIVIQADNDLKLALLNLIQNLELEENTNFDISAPKLNDTITEVIYNLKPTDIIFNKAVKIKPAIKGQEVRIRSAEKSLKIAQASYFPALNLDLSYGTNYLYLYNKDYTNSIFSDQFKNNAEESVGLNLEIPVFNRFFVRNQVLNAQLEIENQHLTLEDEKKNLYKKIQTAYLNTIAAEEKYTAAMEAVKFTSESFNYAQERYQAGKSTVFEFNEAKTKLTQSLSEKIQAKYDYIFMSKILDFYYGEFIKL